MEEDKDIQQEDLKVLQKEYQEALKKYNELVAQKNAKDAKKPEEADYRYLRYAKKGDSVEVHYIGYLKEGLVEFDNSYTRKIPLEFTVGVGQVCACHAFEFVSAIQLSRTDGTTHDSVRPQTSQT